MRYPRPRIFGTFWTKLGFSRLLGPRGLWLGRTRFRAPLGRSPSVTHFRYILEIQDCSARGGLVHRGTTPPSPPPAGLPGKCYTVAKTEMCSELAQTRFPSGKYMPQHRATVELQEFRDFFFPLMNSPSSDLVKISNSVY